MDRKENVAYHQRAKPVLDVRSFEGLSSRVRSMLNPVSLASSAHRVPLPYTNLILRIM